jgi:hypothetical protein
MAFDELRGLLPVVPMITGGTHQTAIALVGGSAEAIDMTDDDRLGVVDPFRRS